MGRSVSYPSGAIVAFTILVVDPARLGFDHQAFEHTIAGEGDHVARIERKHPLIALEACTGAKTHIQREGHLRHLAPLGPGRSQAINALGVTAVDQNHVGNTGVNLVERSPDIIGEGQRFFVGRMAAAPSGEYHWCAFGHCCTALCLAPCAQEIAALDERGGQHRAVIKARTRDGLP